MKKIKMSDISFPIMAISLIGGFIIGLISSHYPSLKCLEGLGRVLFVVGLIFIPTMFINMAYVFWKEQNKKLALKTAIFALIMAVAVSPLIIMICCK